MAPPTDPIDCCVRIVDKNGCVKTLVIDELIRLPDDAHGSQIYMMRAHEIQGRST